MMYILIPRKRAPKPIPREEEPTRIMSKEEIEYLLKTSRDMAEK